MDDKPQITAQEVSWHSTVAAIRARKAATAQGIDPEARAALAHAASEGRDAMPMISMGTLWAMEAIEPVTAALCGGSRYADQTLVCHTLLEPETVLLSLLAGDLETVQAGMLETALAITAERGQTLDNWFAEEMRRLRHLTGGQADATPKKD